jgi:hypothetical protein
MTVSAIEGQEAFDPISERDAASRPRRGVVVRVPDAADRGLDAAQGEVFGALDRAVLHAAVAGVDQSVTPHRAPVVQRLLEGVEDEAGTGRRGDTPADDSAGESINDEGRVDEASPGCDIGELGDPSSVSRRMSRLRSSARQQDARGRVGTQRLELAIHTIRQARHRPVGDRGFRRLALDDALKAHHSHQAFDGTSGDVDAPSTELPPDFSCPVDLEVRLEYPLDRDAQVRVAPASHRAFPGSAALRHMRVVRRRGDRRPGGLRSDLWKRQGQQALAAAGNRQIGSTPSVVRCSSMKAIMA